MRTFSHKNLGHSVARVRSRVLAFAMLIGSSLPACVAGAQTSDVQDLAEKVQKLSDALSATQSQLEQSKQEIEKLRNELQSVKQQLPQTGGAAAEGVTPSSSDKSVEALAAAVEEIREQQALQATQIATHDQTKVESESKYPIKITGMLLMNGFVNTGAVDMAATPTVAIGGNGSVGATVRQTVLGIDARGPHILGARSFGDLRVDFASGPSSTSSSTGYGGSYASFLRLRTAHAGLEWDKTQLLFSLDRPIISPETPTSLTAVAEPALAWSGNLWVWNPQAVFSQNIGPVGARNLQFQVALIDPADAPLTPSYSPQVTSPPNSAEQSSRPGVEARFALLGSERNEDRSHLGVGGYFARHDTTLGRYFDSWAATLDTRLNLPAGLQMTGSAYRGLGLGGLGGGAYKDFAYKSNPNTGGYFFKALDDVGGWAQLKESINERLEFNGAFGIDNVFSGQMRRYIITGGTMYQNLTINRTFTGNVIFSPSAYLLFSLEYRHIQSSPIAATPAQSNIIGLGAGYKF